MSDRLRDTSGKPGTRGGPDYAVFTIDHLMQLTMAIRALNRQYYELLEHEQDQFKRYRIECEWGEAIHVACKAYCDDANQLVNRCMNLATDAVSCSMQPIFVRKDGNIAMSLPHISATLAWKAGCYMSFAMEHALIQPEEEESLPTEYGAFIEEVKRRMAEKHIPDPFLKQ